MSRMTENLFYHQDEGGSDSNIDNNEEGVVMPEMILETEQPHLYRQLQAYFSTLETRLPGRVDDAPRVEKGLAWAKQFISWKLMTRVHRADDLTLVDEEGGGIVDKARELARAFIGDKKHHFFVTCIDGRNLPVVMLLHVPHFGGAIRTQAGELFGFNEAMHSGVVVLDYNSYEAQAIKQLLLDRFGETVFYSLDSHFGCAAGGRLQKGFGRPEKDGGLLFDIQRKLRIAEGIAKLAKDLRADGEDIADIIPQLFSYDPHDGTMYMGLEMHVDEVAEEGGFTTEVLERLSQEGSIVRTWDFLKNPRIVAELEKLNLPIIDLRNEFAESLLSGWEAITELYDNGKGFVYQIIHSSLIDAYRKGGFIVGNVDDLAHKKISLLAIENKAKVMMKNLVARWSIARAEHEWPFSEHLEQGIVITESGFGPFENPEGSSTPPDTFAVFSKEDLPALLDHTKLAVRELIRPFRKDGRIQDPMGMLEGDDFVEAPVVIMNHGILRNLSPQAWEQLHAINFVEIFAQINWDDPAVRFQWGQTEIQDLLSKKISELNFTFGESNDLINAFWSLFERAQFLMNDPEFRSWVVNGRVLLVNKLVDYDRRPQVIAPMVF